MLRDYRDWLESELKLLGNASHHAYSFGQANMAKRALDRLDAELAAALFVPVDRELAANAVDALEALASADPALAALRDRLQTAVRDDA